MAKKENPKTREDILQQAISDIKSKFGDGAIMRLGDGGVSPVEVIPTGILPLDVALGTGGLPRGRIIEIFGPEGSGKTTLALHPLAEAQRMGGVAAFIDAEHALDPSLAISVGVDAKSLFISQPDSGEQALYILDSLVRSGAVDIIVIDSVAALTPQAEIDGKIGETQVGLQARLMSYALRRLASSISKSKCVVVFINQLRAQIGMSGYGGAQETTTGGRALKFYSSVRIEVRRGKSITRGDSIIGHELWIKIVKNKQAPPFRTAHASLIYGKGIPKAMAVLDMAIDMDVVKKKGSWLAYKGETLGQGKEKVAQLLEEQPELMEEISREVMGIVAETSGLVNLLPPKSSEDEDTEDRDEDEAMERALLGEEDVLELDVESAD
ncbi:MAG: recombinase RecA [Acetomicrobium sp.]|nr:recombinase RecA [Acetomicrobium sp.]HXK99263.1 recombinase RecA [Acetomicrobium sp.]